MAEVLDFLPFKILISINYGLTTLVGFCFKEDIIKSNTARGIKGEGHINYIIPFEKMKPIKELITEVKESENLMKLCEKCKVPIPLERLEILPETKTCVKCSQEEALVGITIWDKNTSIFIPVKSEIAERFDQLQKIDGRLNRL